MNCRRLASLTILAIFALVTSLPAATFTFSPDTATFTGTGVGFNTSNNTTLDFDLALQQLSTVSLTNPGDVIHVPLASLTLSETLSLWEVDNLSMNIRFTLDGVQFQFSPVIFGAAMWPLNDAWMFFDTTNQVETMPGGHQIGARILLSGTENGDMRPGEIWDAGLLGSPDTDWVWARLELLSAPSEPATPEVPEPGTYAMMGAGLIALATLRKKLRK